MKKIAKSIFHTSGEIAKTRTELTVSADRLDSSPDRMDELRREMTGVLAKYINIENDSIRICITFARDSIPESGVVRKRGISDVKTIQIK
ncbi:MAG: cell division topological specificity factor MinE [Clostridiales bacterium]|nr:cell division topological specificity factor MinE [Clostridiales bacterium]